MNYPNLKAELDAGHPDTGPYNADDQIAADQLNTVNRTVDVKSVPGAAIMDQTDDTEYQALTHDDRARWLGICGIDQVDVTSGIAKSEEAALFGPGTQTRTNLLALKKQDVSRAEEISDLLEYSGLITAGHVASARRL